MKPKVSVIIATYRREETLKKALESLAKQTDSDFEIVLVDDNACAEWNEKVRAVKDAFCKAHPSMLLTHIVNETNRGSAETRNIGIDASCGTYITFLDDDDIYLPDKIKRQVAFMQAGGYDYSITDLSLYKPNGKLIEKRVHDYIKSTTQEALCVYHLKYHLTGTDTMMFTRDYLFTIGKFAPIDAGDEFYLMERAIKGGGRFGYLAECDVIAYVHEGEGGLSSGEGKVAGENVLYAHKRTYFKELSFKDRRQIVMRHYAVLAFAYLRAYNYAAFIKNGIFAFLSAPFACIGLLTKIVTDKRR